MFSVTDGKKQLWSRRLADQGQHHQNRCRLAAGHRAAGMNLPPYTVSLGTEDLRLAGIRGALVFVVAFHRLVQHTGMGQHADATQHRGDQESPKHECYSTVYKFHTPNVHRFIGLANLIVVPRIMFLDPAGRASGLPDARSDVPNLSFAVGNTSKYNALRNYRRHSTGVGVGQMRRTWFLGLTSNCERRSGNILAAAQKSPPERKCSGKTSKLSKFTYN